MTSSGIWYVVLTVVLVLAYPVIQQAVRNKRWQRIIFCTYIPFAFAYTVVTVFLVISSYQKDLRLESLEEQELVLSDLGVSAKYIFKLAQDGSGGGRSMGLNVTAGFVNTTSSVRDIIELHSDYKHDISYPDKKTAELTLSFIPVNRTQFINRKISVLESYDLFVLPYAALLKNMVKQKVEPQLTVELRILVNGRQLNIYEETLVVPSETRVLNLRPKEGLFKDVENKYLRLAQDVER